MPNTRALYNEEVVQAHREALAALRELLAAEQNPVERRRLACAILKTRPVKLAAEPPAQAPQDNREQLALPQRSRIAEEQPTPFWSPAPPAPVPAPFGDLALAHPHHPPQQS